MEIACLDFEGVLVPEIWIAVAERTGIDSLRATTRDISDYDVLMKQRFKILDENNLKLSDIQEVIAEMEPLAGAVDFLNWLREYFQVLILSDTFYEFAAPLVKKFGYPPILCHTLINSPDDRIIGYTLRQEDPKRKAVQAFQSLNFKVIATGDSFNDISMLSEADTGFLFRPSSKVIEKNPQFDVVTNYEQLKDKFLSAKNKFNRIFA
jgi:phosphoserine / homoserine phosphotransferase